jgi:hypothetical protein
MKDETDHPTDDEQLAITGMLSKVTAATDSLEVLV